MVFQGFLMEASNKFQGVSIGSQGCYNSVSRKFLGDSKVLGVSSKFQGCFQSVSKKFHVAYGIYRSFLRRKL